MSVNYAGLAKAAAGLGRTGAVNWSDSGRKKFLHPVSNSGLAVRRYSEGGQRRRRRTGREEARENVTGRR